MKKTKDRIKKEIKEHTGTMNETASDAYKKFIDDLIGVVRPPQDKRELPDLLGWIAGVNQLAENHKEFLEQVGDMVGCRVRTEEAVKDAVKTTIATISTDIFEIKMKRLTEFHKRDLFIGIIYKLLWRK